MPAQPISFMWVSQETDKVLESADDLASLESLVRQYSRFVFKVAYGVLRNAHDAEDVVQEVFLRVHRSGTGGITDIKAWLATVSFRVAIDRVRKPQPVELADMDFADDSADAEHRTIQGQLVLQVHRLIAALPYDLRYPLVLSAIEEMDSGTIAQILGISEAAVRGRIFRARAVLKEKLASLTNRDR
jgi:RNA polymerase sigma-70 factor (ECF subfamily)